MEENIPNPFLIYASDILGDTHHGLSGSNILKAFNMYAVEYEKEIVHSRDMSMAANKRTALLDNLNCFLPEQQYRILKELCEHHSFNTDTPEKVTNLKIQLIARYGKHFGHHSESTLEVEFVEVIRHWLGSYAKSYTQYESAIQKFDNNIFERNLLDDLRLSLELLLKEIFSNEKSLENQISDIGKFINKNGGSKHFSNMFRTLIDYYTKYQNSYVKHDDAVIEEEIEFIFEMTSSFMKHLVKMERRN